MTHTPTFPEFNLSRLGALRSLQVTDWASVYSPSQDLSHDIVMEVFSTITSPVFSELVVVLVDDGTTHLPHEVMLFQTLRKMQRVRPFRLVFLFEGPCLVKRGGHWEFAEVRQELGQALDDVTSKGFLDFLDSPPTICTAPWSHDWHTV